MSRHATAEVLSAYLDDELEEVESREIADHLERCTDCRARFASMRRVVTTLRRMERRAPPPLLAENVERRMSLDGRRASTLERLEDHLRDMPQSSSLFFTFALVAALAVIVYLFAHGVERSQRPRTALVLAPQVEAPTGEVRETREVAGRTFDLIDGVWWERGLEQPVADFHVTTDSPAGREVLALHPELAELGRRVVLRIEGSVVELRAGE